MGGRHRVTQAWAEGGATSIGHVWHERGLAPIWHHRRPRHLLTRRRASVQLWLFLGSLRTEGSTTPGERVTPGLVSLTSGERLGGWVMITLFFIGDGTMKIIIIS